MAEAVCDVVGIGNAIVDVLAPSPDAFLEGLGLAKGSMNLIDADRALELYNAMGPATEASGGSAGNTIAGLANFGGSGAYIGKVADDELGRVFAHDIRAAGAKFDVPLAQDGSAPTARCLIFVTPDAQRTMCTYLGACVELGPKDVDEQTIAGAQVTYMEGYLWDPEDAKDAFRKAMQIAHASNRKVSLSLSDSFCVERHRDDFRHLVDNDVDILFANEDELKSLYQTDSFDDALQAVRGKVQVAALTRSENGSVVISGDEVHVIDAEPVDKVVDTTGAGDLYASGFLYGLTNGKDLATCARLGGMAAAEVISHYGARPERSLKELAASKGL